MTSNNYVNKKQEKREYIIKKCYECFVQGGIEHSSTRDFCAAANVNPNTLYYYFDTKDKILQECVNYGYMKLEDAIFQTIANGGVSDGMFSQLLDVWLTMAPDVRFLHQAVSSPDYELYREGKFRQVSEFYDRIGREFAKRFQCPYGVIRDYVQEMFSLISYFSLWGSKAMAEIQYKRIISDLQQAVEDYREQTNDTVNETGSVELE